MKQIALYPTLVLLVISIGSVQQGRAAERPDTKPSEALADATTDNIEQVSP